MSAATLEVEGVRIKPTNLIELRASQIVKNATTLTLREVVTTDNNFALLKKSIGTPKIREVALPGGGMQRDQVSPHGMLNPISVRPLGEPGRYALIDGGHRLAAWTELFGDSLPIPAFVVDLNDVQTMEAQIEGNFHVKKTKPAEYVRQIKRLLEAYPLRSIEEQAARLHMEPATLRQWFGLMKLTGTEFVEKTDADGQPVQRSKIQDAVDTGELPLSAAFVISTANDADPTHQQFWAEKQTEFFHEALARKETPQGVAKFCMESTAAIKEIKKAFREKRDPNAATIETPPVVRKLGELKVELARQSEAVLSNEGNDTLRKQVEELAAAYPDALKAVRQEGYLAGVQYCLQVDPETIAERRRQKEEAIQKRKESQDDKKAGSKATSIARSAGMFGRKLS